MRRVVVIALVLAGYGRYPLDTVFPKGYDSAPPHIHVSFGHPDAEGLVTELVFGGPTARAEYDITLRAR